MLSVPVSVLDLSTVSQGQTSADALAATIALAKRADELGYSRFWTAEHHNMPEVAATSPAVMIAALGAHTSRIRVGSGGVMLPNHSPYVVAEQFAALEALYPNRVDLGLGRAPGTDQVTAWALRRALAGDGVDDFEDNVGLIRAWLSPQGVATGAGRQLAATPAAASYPDVWLLGSSDYAARLAGRLGLRYCYAAHFGQLDPAGVLQLYRDSFVPGDLAQPYAMVCTSAIVAGSDAEAQYLAGPARVRWLGMRSGRREAVPSPEAAARELGADAASIPAVKHVGTPERVRHELEALIEDAGVQEVMVTSTTYDLSTKLDTLAALAA